ncbi:MAG: hypothetical protein QF596_08445 [Acidimicrobiales bacterium]|nr:hypothetical protein [Acidimicrobiales bacterium]HJM97988.1 hypothetical protein [Acidimicrobiales bacterium]
MVTQRSLLGSSSLSRRAFLLGASSSALAIACSSSSSNSSDANETIDEMTYLRSGFADGLIMPSTLVVGSSQRAPFFLHAADGIPVVNNLPDGISGTLLLPSGKSTPVILAKYGEGIPTPYFLLEFVSNEVGLHKLSVEYGNELQSISFLVVERDEVDLVQVGDPMRIADIPTFDNPLGFKSLCTRFEPCPFHSITLEKALSNNTPTVLLISTPGFCQTSICGPSLELLLTAVLGKAASINVIHAEVYSEPEKIIKGNDLQDLLAPVIIEYGMDFEPSLIVADENGIVRSRLDYTFDQIELNKALSLIN